MIKVDKTKTPRTNRKRKELANHSAWGAFARMADFAEELENELNIANERIKGSQPRVTLPVRESQLVASRKIKKRKFPRRTEPHHNESHNGRWIK